MRRGSYLLNSQSATGVPQPSETYGYTPLNQLSAVNSTSYGYDKADNITQLTAGATLAYDNANELTTLTQGTSSTSFGYDQHGNRTSMTPASGSPATYTYDQANRLTAYSSGSTTANYAYNGVGLRMNKTVNGTAEPFVWDVAGGLPLLLKDGTTSYVYGPGGLPLEQISSSGAVLWYHHDQLGSTRVLTNASGAVAATSTYDAYGNLTAHAGAVSNPFGYAGEYTDVESGLHYLRARYYDPSTAQFMSRDPAAASTRSRYAYVGGNPLNGTDPSGMSPWGSMAGMMASTACGGGSMSAFSSDITSVSSPTIVGPIIDGPIILGPTDVGGGSPPSNEWGNITDIIGGLTGVGGGGVTGIGPNYSEGANWPPAATDAGNTGAGWVVKDTNVPGQGIILQPGDAEGNAGAVRIMNPTPQYPGGRVIVYNGYGQPLNADGEVGTREDTHHQLTPTGELHVP